MNDNTKELLISSIFVCLKNLTIVALFCYLAVYFNYWWISLFSIIFFRSTIKFEDVTEVPETIELTHQITCDYCGEVLFVEDIENAVHREMNNKNWKRIQIGNEWKDLCPYCYDKILRIISKPQETSVNEVK